MKIDDFCSMISEEKDSLFQALRGLQKIDARTLLEDGDTTSWDPWTRIASPEPAPA